MQPAHRTNFRRDADSKHLLLSSRSMRGLSGKVILLHQNIPPLVEAGWHVTLLCEKFDPALREIAGVSINEARGWVLNKTRKLRRFNRRHEQMARSGKFDLVVSHGETLQQDILHVHNCRHLEHEHINGECLLPGVKPAADLQARQLSEQRFRLVVANSQLMKSDLVKRYGIPANRIEVVHPGYDAQRFHTGVASVQSRELRSQLGIGKQPLIGLITSGKLRQRGADLLIAAFAQLPANLRAQAHLLIVAKDDFTPYRDMALAAGVAARTHFMPPRADVETYYGALDIYVNPARIETFGMALLEAMACGTACITTRDKVGAAELFGSAMQDALMDEPSAEALHASLLELLQSQSRLQRHATLCAAAATPHDWAANVRQHLDIYTGLHQQILQQRQQTLTTSPAS